MKKQLLLTRMLLLVALLVGSTSVWGTDVITWEKVTNYSSLSTSDTYVIAGNNNAGTTWYSLKNNQVSSKSNLPYNSVLTIVDNKITSTVSSDETWTIEATGTTGVYYIKSTKGSYYLQNDGATKSKIDSKSNTDENNCWKIHYQDSYTDTKNITYTVTGLYLVKGDGRELAVYKGTSGGSDTYDFRCYASDNYKNIDKCEIVLFKKVVTSSYNITTVANNDSYGEVGLSGTIITAVPADGYRVKSGAEGYTVTAGTASVTNNGNNTFTVVPSTDCTIQINFEVIPIHTATFSINGETSSQDFGEGADITFPDDPDDINGKKFVGWITETVDGTTTDEPEFVTSATMPTSDITYYAVFATPVEGDPVETLSQTLTYDTWTYSGTTSNKSSYRLFGNGAYVESASFDLSKLSKVKIFGGTYGGSTTYNTVTIGDGTNVWKNVEMTGTGNAKEHSFTNGTALSGTKPLRVISTCGDGSDSGIRMSKIEIYTLVPTYTYTNYCTTATVSKEVSALGWATYVTPYAVEFEAGNAYIVTAADANTTLNEVTSVPANTPVLLKDAGTKTATVLASSDTDVSSNLLKVSDGTKKGDDTYIYVLANKDSGVGFYLWSSEAAAIPEGKVYLDLTGTGAKRVEFISFDGTDEPSNETNSIVGVEALKNNDTAYNLAGQKVDTSYKGIVIINGKKYINK